MQTEIQPPSRGPWIIAGAIVLVGIIIALVLVLLLRDKGTPAATPTPAIATTGATVAPTLTPSASASPSSTASPVPPSPQPSQETAVRNAATKQANKDRPGDLKHVGNVKFFNDKTCPNRQGASASVRFSSSPKSGSYLFCQQGGKWVYNQGPLYGE